MKLQKRARSERAAEPLSFRIAVADTTVPVAQEVPKKKNKRGWLLACCFPLSLSSPRPVVIIGAGTAGLSAAKSLAELSAEVDVVVLEGRSRLGGRIDTLTLRGASALVLCVLCFSHTVADGARVDRGASYIHGCNRSDNWVFNLAKELRVRLVREHGGYQAGWLNECIWVGDTGGVLPRSDVARAWSVFENVRDAVQQKANELQAEEKDISIGEFIEHGLSAKLSKQLGSLSRASQKVFSRLASTVWGYVGPLEKLSARLMADSFKPGDELALDADFPAMLL